MTVNGGILYFYYIFGTLKGVLHRSPCHCFLAPQGYLCSTSLNFAWWQEVLGIGLFHAVKTMKNPLDITSWWLLLYTWWLKIVIICPDQARVITILITCPKGLSNKSAKTWQVIHGETLVDREKSVLLIRTFVSVIRVMFHMVIINHLEPKGILFASGIVFIPSIRLFMRKCAWSWEAQSWVFFYKYFQQTDTRDLLGDLWKIFSIKRSSDEQLPIEPGPHPCILLFWIQFRLNVKAAIFGATALFLCLHPFDVMLFFKAMLDIVEITLLRWLLRWFIQTLCG